MAATIVNVHEAKTHLSRLLARAETGEQIIIAQAQAKRIPLVTGDLAIPRHDIETIW